MTAAANAPHFPAQACRSAREDGISAEHRELHAKNILLQLFRTAHRQFPWQQRPSANALVRYFKIFSRPPLNAIVTKRLGMDAQALYTVGLALTGCTWTGSRSTSLLV